MFCWDQHSFTQMTVVRFESRLHCSIRTGLNRINSQRRQRKIFTEFLSQVFTQVGHIRKRKSMFLPKPFPNLLCPEFFLIEGFKEYTQVLETNLPDIFNRFCLYCCG